MEALAGEKTPGRIAKEYGIHPNSVGLWKKQFLEKGPELFAEDSTVQQYERRLANLEQLLGKKEVEIALLKKLLRPACPGGLSREVAYADFTELLYADGRRKGYLIPIVDHVSKMALGERWASER